MSIKERAVENFIGGFNCAQSVILTYSETFGLDKETAKAVSIGFGGGMGDTQKTCGAVTGGIIAIGYKYYNGKDIPKSKKKIFKKTKELINRFEKNNNSCECKVLLGIDLNTEEGIKIYKEQKMSELKCREYVRNVCNILEEIL